MTDKVSNRLPSLDGWRAFSILCVIADHGCNTYGFPKEWTPVVSFILNGNLGVRIFFIISGFLITWLMLQEQNKRGIVNLKHFYARRALRILPVYCVYLGVLALLQYFTPFSQNLRAWVANITFTTGLTAMFGNVEYPAWHLWSLAVEEQFYIIWPTVFVLCCLGSRASSALKLLFVPVLIAPLCRYIHNIELFPTPYANLFSQFTFATNFDSLAIGCAGAILLFKHRDKVVAALTAWPHIVATVAFGVFAVSYCLQEAGTLDNVAKSFGKTIEGIGVAVLLLQSVLLPTWGVYRVLNVALVVWVGTLSYSLYIWQQLFSARPELFSLGPMWWMSFPGWMLTTLVAACASYYLLERPFMSLRARLRDA